MPTLPTYFVLHGGGPSIHVREQLGLTYNALEVALKQIPEEIGHVRPLAVLAISGHWHEDQFTLRWSARPHVMYNYTDFPGFTYEVPDTPPGAHGLAKRIQQLLDAARLPLHLEESGEDPAESQARRLADAPPGVPVLQLSVRKGHDAATHIAAGRALAPLRDEHVLIIGSALAYHTLRQMGPSAYATGKAFDDWLYDTLVQSSPTERVRRLLAWKDAPEARKLDPAEEHLIPIMVTAGAAEDEPAERVHHEESVMGGLVVSSFRFGRSAPQ